MSDKKNIIFDSQILNSIQMCALRTKLYFEDNLRPATTPEPLEAGSLLHKMMEIYYRAVKEFGSEITYSDENFKRVVDKAIEKGHVMAPSLNLSIETVDEVIFQFTENIKHWRMDGWLIKEVESPFVVQIYDSEELSINYCGMRDLLIYDNQLKDAVVDHKSMRRDYPPDIMSNQFTGYAHASNVPTVIINKVGFQKSLKPDERFRRPALLYSKELKQRWINTTIWWGKQYAWFLEYGEWPENRTSCDKYGGCLFRPVCSSSSDEAREFLIQTKYTLGDSWDPTKILEEKE